MSELQFKIRRIEQTDLEEWFRLRKLLWDEIPDEGHHSEMIDIYEHTDTQLVLAADVGGGKLGGFLEASIRPFVEDCDTDHVGYLEGWFVENQFRRHGIGASLVHNAENWARRKGCTEMASDSEVGNDLSLKSHLRLGYKETSRLVHLRKDLV